MRNIFSHWLRPCSAIDRNRAWTYWRELYFETVLWNPWTKMTSKLEMLTPSVCLERKCHTSDELGNLFIGSNGWEIFGLHISLTLNYAQPSQAITIHGKYWKLHLLNKSHLIIILIWYIMLLDVVNVYLIKVQKLNVFMMTSSNGNIFRVTGPLCGEFTGPGEFPAQRASHAELWCFLWSVPE